VTPRGVVTLLRWAATQPWGAAWRATFPIAGVDGTLARRWHGRPASGRVRAKTGTLDKVTTLAGYFAADTRHPLGFAILVNDIPAGQRASARAAADDIIDALAAYLGSP
jgi:D-alanyl-D-alanine carboxypeptidase/D-alanyl-D-alanine-endopeptidase (penicillin-binding protein 4)